MNINDTIRAWKDRGFRKTVNQADAQANPAGIGEIDQAALQSISGATNTTHTWTCPPGGISNNGCGGGHGGTPGTPCIF